VRQRRHTVGLDQVETAQLADARVVQFPGKYGSEDPAAGTARAQIRRLIEHAIDELPAPFRIVFVMREIEGCSVEETATQLKLRAETVKTRLHRTRRLLRTALVGTLAATLNDAFPFLGQRCERMTETVLHRVLDGDSKT
jgi:RNA polymerase sigma-70 factor (ECF subfamily)